MVESGLDDLARRVSEGDSEAFQTLYESHLDTIYRYVYYKVGNGQLAEDLTQHIFMKAWEAINRYQWREAAFPHRPLAAGAGKGPAPPPPPPPPRPPPPAPPGAGARHGEKER